MSSRTSRPGPEAAISEQDPETDRNPAEALNEWKKSPTAEKIHEGLVVVAETAQANLEKTIHIGQQVAQVDLTVRGNTAMIHVLATQVSTIAAKGEVTARFMERLDSEALKSNESFKTELAALKTEVSETKDIAKAIAKHLGLPLED